MLDQFQSPIRRIQNSTVVPILTSFVLVIAGCHRQGDANAEMAKAVKELEQAAPGQPSAPASTGPPVAQQMNEAMVAYKGGDYLEAVMRLEVLRSKAIKTPDQTMAVQNAMAAVMTELYSRAEKGDTRAQQAIKQYQEERNRR
jgi:hypothetical protein